MFSESSVCIGVQHFAQSVTLVVNDHSNLATGSCLRRSVSERAIKNQHDDPSRAERENDPIHRGLEDCDFGNVFEHRQRGLVARITVAKVDG